MDYKKKIEIPFGAFDSELEHQEINIPNGFKAVIDGNKIILTKIESEDEKIRKEIINFLELPHPQFVGKRDHEKWISWLEKQDPKKHEEELEKAYKTADKVQYRRGYEDATKEMEKQGESYTKKDIADLNEFVKEYSFNIPSDIYNFLPREKQSAWINEIENAIKAGAQWAERQGESYTKRDVDDAWLKGMCDAKRELEKQKDTNVFDVPKISIKDAIDVTSRMQYIEDDMKPIANFVIDYASWNLHKDEWNQPVLEVPLFRVLDALIQRGKPYCECSQNTEKQGEQKPQRMISAEAKEAMYNKPANTVEPKCEESKTKIFDAPTPFEDKLYAFVLACEILVDPSKREFILEHSQEILDAAKEQIGKEQSSTWSKEDEKEYKYVLKFVDNILNNCGNKKDYEHCKRCYDWLKSLKPQNTWKPSDEQMEALENAIRYGEEEIIGILSLLYNDLKKLREDKL